MGTIFGREPVAIAGFISIALNLGLTFGIKLDGDQVALINALVVAGLALIVRSTVTAPASLATEAAAAQDQSRMDAIKKDNG